MPSMFHQIFGCCLRQQAAPEDPIDETSHLIPPTIDPPIPVYTDIEPPDTQFIKERMEDIVRAKQSKMVNVLSATPYYLNDSGLPTSRSNGSTSRTRERPLRTSSRSPPPSTRSGSSTSLIRTDSGQQVPYSSGHNALNIRIIRGGLRGLERGRSQTLKRRTAEPEGDLNPENAGGAPTNTESGDADDGARDRLPVTKITPPESQESISSPRQPASLEETPKQKEYVFDGVADLTGGWGD